MILLDTFPGFSAEDYHSFGMIVRVFQATLTAQTPLSILHTSNYFFV